MYPAIEITLHLDGVCAAQRRSRTSLESASRDLHGGTNLLPPTQPFRIFEPSSVDPHSKSQGGTTVLVLDGQAVSPNSDVSMIALLHVLIGTNIGVRAVIPRHTR
jgi:hypothetical protein